MEQFSVVLPAYNEAGVVGSVVRSIIAGYPSSDVIVVDDGSHDATAKEAEQAGARVLVHPMNGGYGRSLKDGILAAKHDVIVIADPDGSYPISGIGEILDMFSRGYDLVVGARRGPEYRGSFMKMPARIVLKWLVEFTTGRRIPDINSGLRVFKRSDVLPYFPDLCNGFSFTTTQTLIYLLTGKFVGYTSIDYGPRVGSSKVRILRDSLRTLQYITETVLAYNPLKLFLLLTLFLLLLGLLAIIAGTLNHLDTLVIGGYIAWIGSVIVFSLGLTTDLLRRIAHRKLPPVA